MKQLDDSALVSANTSVVINHPGLDYLHNNVEAVTVQADDLIIPESSPPSEASHFQHC